MLLSHCSIYDKFQWRKWWHGIHHACKPILSDTIIRSNATEPGFESRTFQLLVRHSFQLIWGTRQRSGWYIWYYWVLLYQRTQIIICHMTVDINCNSFKQVSHTCMIVKEEGTSDWSLYMSSDWCIRSSRVGTISLFSASIKRTVTITDNANYGHVYNNWTNPSLHIIYHNYFMYISVTDMYRYYVEWP